MGTIFSAFCENTAKLNGFIPESYENIYYKMLHLQALL